MLIKTKYFKSDRPEMLRFITNKPLKKMLNECGYEILKIDAISLGRIKLRKKIFNFLTNNKFKTLDVFQFGITAKKRVDI